MKMGILGGSGLYKMEQLEELEWIEKKTPFGMPSDAILKGLLNGQEVYFLPRHGRGHTLSPSEINHRANIYAFKELGVDRVLSVSAVGSLKQEIKPRDVVIPDQYFDRTKRDPQDHTFFGDGIVAHIAFGEPLCPEMREHIHTEVVRAIEAHSEYNGRSAHKGGTYVNMEGPAFSTRAESIFHRQCGFDVIGMTSLAEAKLCREAELCYCPMAMVTDYDCWKVEEEGVTVEMVIAHLMANVSLATHVIATLVQQLPEKKSCTCGESLATALITQPDAMPEKAKRKLGPIIAKYVK